MTVHIVLVCFNNWFTLTVAVKVNLEIKKDITTILHEGFFHICLMGHSMGVTNAKKYLCSLSFNPALCNPISFLSINIKSSPKDHIFSLHTFVFSVSYRVAYPFLRKQNYPNLTNLIRLGKKPVLENT